MSAIILWLAKTFGLSALQTVGAKIWKWAKQPPGLYAVLVLAAVLALWLAYHRGYSAGQGACDARYKAAAAAADSARRAANTAAVAASETRTVADTRIIYRNQEVIRYVTREAAKLPDGNAECVPAAVADKLRSIE